MFGDGLQWINIGANISMMFGFPWWDVGPCHIHPMFSPWFLWIQAILGLLGGRMSATHQPQRSATMHQTALVTSSTCILNLDLLRCSAGASEFGDGDFWHPKRSLPTKNQGKAWEGHGKILGKTWDKIWDHEKNMGTSSVDGGFNMF